MRIQHNIMAMNAYRNYNTNTKALSGNLEKLSSGYKINRAGDDAAGLAISEKMRAQITGLDAAQKNVKDGISLVKTAEGAMQEIQDMLNRMDYLATQSANGTYDSSVDRTNLQKEVNALRDEIDRIADSANFNGIKLLNGDLAGVKAQAAYTETLAAGEYNGVDRLLTSDIESTNAAQNNSKVVLDKYAGTAAKGSFSISFSGLEFGLKAGAKATATATAGFGTLKITIGTLSVEIKTSNFASDALSIAVGSDGVIASTAEIAASAVAQAFLNKAAGKASATSATVNLNGVDWKVTVDGSSVNFAQKDFVDSEAKTQLNFAVKTEYTAGTVASTGVGVTSLSAERMQDGTTIETKSVMKGDNKGAEAVFKMYDSDIRDGAKITLGTATYTIKLGADSKVTETSNVIDLSSYEAGAEGLLNAALTRLATAASHTATIQVATKSGGQASVAFTLSVRGDGIALMRASAPASAGQVYFKSVDDFKDVFKLTFEATTVEHKAVAESGGLKLQIGDTSDKFNQMGVHVGDMHVNAMGFDLDSKGEITKAGKSIADIDISTQEGAAEAIQTIKNAINYVSGVRGDLGAVQNRLEHTGNNLSVMAENIQDAESTIRDTDVADEMMKYVKNNILVQSAQAMLAQANQVPQGVLQLLG